MEKKSENTSVTTVAKYSNDYTGTFYSDLRKEEFVIDLALKMAMKGMSEEGIADVLGITPATVRSGG